MLGNRAWLKPRLTTAAHTHHVREKEPNSLYWCHTYTHLQPQFAADLIARKVPKYLTEKWTQIKVVGFHWRISQMDKSDGGTPGSACHIFPQDSSEVKSSDWIYVVPRTPSQKDPSVFGCYYSDPMHSVLLTETPKVIRVTGERWHCPTFRRMKTTRQADQWTTNKHCFQNGATRNDRTPTEPKDKTQTIGICHYLARGAKQRLYGGLFRE